MGNTLFYIQVQQIDTTAQKVPEIKKDSLKTGVGLDTLATPVDSLATDSLIQRSVVETDSIVPEKVRPDTLAANNRVSVVDSGLLRKPLSTVQEKTGRSDSLSHQSVKKVADPIKSVEISDVPMEEMQPDTILESGPQSSSQVFFETLELNDAVARAQSSSLTAHKDWLSALLLISVLTIGFLRLSAFKLLKELFNASIYFHAANNMFSSVNMRNSKPSITLVILFLLNTSLFIFEVLVFYDRTLFNQQGPILLLLIFGILLAFGAIKSALYRMVGFVFETAVPTAEYLFNSSLLSKVYGVILIPLIVIIPFVNLWVVPNLIKMGVGLFIVLFLIQLIRGAKIILQQSLSIIYMFLYFCALEILPLTILYKILF